VKVQIEGDLYLETDGMQFIIKRYNGKKDKKGYEQFQAIGYYSTLEHAIKRIVKLKLMDSTATTLIELLRDVRSIEDYIKATVKI